MTMTTRSFTNNIRRLPLEIQVEILKYLPPKKKRQLARLVDDDFWLRTLRVALPKLPDAYQTIYVHNVSHLSFAKERFERGVSINLSITDPAVSEDLRLILASCTRERVAVRHMNFYLMSSEALSVIVDSQIFADLEYISCTYCMTATRPNCDKLLQLFRQNRDTLVYFALEFCRCFPSGNNYDYFTESLANMGIESQLTKYCRPYSRCVITSMHMTDWAEEEISFGDARLRSDNVWMGDFFLRRQALSLQRCGGQIFNDCDVASQSVRHRHHHL